MSEKPTEPPKGMMVGGAMIDLAISYELLTQRLEKVMRPLSLNMTQLSLLFHFSWHPEQPKTVSQLVRVMGINQPGVTKATASMIEKKWLRKEADPQDARIKRLFITDKGLEVLEQAKDTTLPTLIEGFSCLTDDQLESFSDQLHTLKCWLDKTRAQ